MTIRKATVNDVKLLGDLFDSYRVFYKKEPDPAGAQQFVSERITQNESVIYVAEHDDHLLVGFVQLYPLFSSTRMKRLWLLNDLYVQPEYRGLGVSVALIDAAKELCRTTESCGMMLETAKGNIIGNKLYQKTGFALDADHNYFEWEVKSV
ncbi:MAG: GNAT family N-acetyltransferase [Ferruginibacter sp.]|nr:GNAT family N-acetyltransferase [Ferruginibacter sp.]